MILADPTLSFTILSDKAGVGQSREPQARDSTAPGPSYREQVVSTLLELGNQMLGTSPSLQHKHTHTPRTPYCLSIAGSLQSQAPSRECRMGFTYQSHWHMAGDSQHPFGVVSDPGSAVLLKY